jgi:hypothetical protein
LDGYFIRTHNLPVSIVNPNQTGIVNQNDKITLLARGAYYYGVEAQGTLYVGGGLSFFANGSRNYGTYEGSKRRIDGIAKSTAGYGFVFDRAGFFTSLMAKYSGPYTLYSASAPSPDQPLPAGTVTYVQGGYVLHDLSLGYGAKFTPGAFLKSLKVRLQINNLFNRDVILMKSAKATAGAINLQTSTFNPLTPRGMFLTVATEF